MEKRRIGNSDLEIAPLALGGNVFGWTADEAASFAVLDAFVDAGGNMIDTADVYSAWVPGRKGGESETVIGRWLKRGGKRDKVVIATKVGFVEGLAPDVIAKACEASLQRLGVDCIDLYYQHKDDAAVPLADSLGAFDKLRRAGKIRTIGLSNFTAERVEEALGVGDAHGYDRPAALQNWYNLVERAKYEGPLRDVARVAQHRISRRTRTQGASSAGRGRRGYRRGFGDGRARVDQGAAGDHRTDRQRDQPRPAGRIGRGADA